VATLGHAIAIAAKAHEHQKDKAGELYIFHPLRVMMKVNGFDAKIVAVLHDVIEDSDWTIEKIRAEGFPDHVLEALVCLTRKENEDYFEMIDRVLKNPIAYAVKIADLEDNMNILRMKELGAKDGERLQKYFKARQILLNR
jgi:(p)ppGpp synthase/HD superfamily hydrolase